METDSWEGSRTVVVSGVPDVLPVSRMNDKLTIHFQSCRRSGGGDVQVVKYPTSMDRVAFVTFDKIEDAERVVRKEQQIMTDNEFPEDFLLTVFPFTRDVFLYVPSAMVDLSVFGRDQSSLIQSLRLAHRSLRFRPFHQQMKANIEGPFAAVQALRQDLICRARRLKSTVSAQTAAAKLKETPPNPRVISHQEFVGSVSCSGPKAKLGPASSNCLSTPLQTTGQDLLLAEEISAKQPGEDDISEKHRSLDRISATKIRKNHTGSCYSSTDYLKGSDQSSSTFFTAKILQTRLTNVSPSSKSDTEESCLQCVQRIRRIRAGYGRLTDT
ncbi:hypothetical protein EPR50_G00236830 [Perca flavescens]|uniref:PAR14-like first RRM domain-containing protein n=1 Tax=Perca flavescens TaxID=8167 RepID=A0A484BZ63_PERFV|nr:hypothetical protein EPR50_G00236830 [Perca flavescens]